MFLTKLILSILCLGVTVVFLNYFDRYGIKKNQWLLLGVMMNSYGIFFVLVASLVDDLFNML